eukprot:1142791-Pelagomonas_calceolata.AAC.2
MGIRRVTNSGPCLTLAMRVKRSLLKSASGASNFTSVSDRMGIKLQSRLGGLMNVKTKLFKRLQSVRDVAVLLGGLQLILGCWPGVLTVIDLNKMDVSLLWKELVRVTDLGGKWNRCGWH